MTDTLAEALPGAAEILPTVSRIDADTQTSGDGWTGVARIHDGTRTGSGVLLATGLHLLTAAHLADSLALDSAEVDFDVDGVRYQRDVLAVESFPYTVIDASGVWHDLAIVTLAQAAPAGADRYDLYTGTAEVGATATLVGYGESATQAAAAGSASGTVRRAGENLIDATGGKLAGKGWQGSLDGQLIYDYDDGTVTHDALGGLLGVSDTGLGGAEAMIAPGDSGGGLFVDNNGAWQIAGINSYITRYAAADINGTADGSIGDIGVATLVSTYADWIESTTALTQTPEGQTGEPPAATAVPLAVAEGQGVWFLVSLGSAAETKTSAHFATRDGTATAGADYIPTEGTLVLDAGERWAKIWVQTLADAAAEGDETFYLALSDPVNASFPDGKTELTAMRTITDDVSLVGVTHLTESLFG
jgi:hypothetical protein